MDLQSIIPGTTPPPSVPGSLTWLVTSEGGVDLLAGQPAFELASVVLPSGVGAWWSDDIDEYGCILDAPAVDLLRSEARQVLEEKAAGVFREFF